MQISEVDFNAALKVNARKWLAGFRSFRSRSFQPFQSTSEGYVRRHNKKKKKKKILTLEEKAERERRQCRKYHRRHRKKRAKYYLKNRVKILLRRKLWCQKNPEKVRSYYVQRVEKSRQERVFRDYLGVMQILESTSNNKKSRKIKS